MLYLFERLRYKFVFKSLKLLVLIAFLFQAFLLFSANKAYSEAVKLEVKEVENKTFWNFYDATLKEIYIDNNTRWSYHRFRYVNEWK